MTLAVIGSRGCGKSAFIRRAWKNSLVFEATEHTVPVNAVDGSRTIYCALFYHSLIGSEVQLMLASYQSLLAKFICKLMKKGITI